MSVCLSVCLSVPALAASASVETSNQRYPLVSLRLFLDFDSWIFGKKLWREKPIANDEKPSGQKLWRGKANMQMITANREPFSRTFGTNGGQQLPEAQLVGRMLLQRLATGATGVKQARYKQLPTDYIPYNITRACVYSIRKYVSIVFFLFFCFFVGVKW